MPGPNFILDKGFKCMSVVTRFRAVKLVTSAKEQVTAITAAVDRPVGIVQDTVETADAGRQVVNVRSIGISQAEAGGVLAIGARCILAADGRLVDVGAAAAGTVIVGEAWTAAAAAGDWFDLFLTPGAKV